MKTFIVILLTTFIMLQTQQISAQEIYPFASIPAELKNRANTVIREMNTAVTMHSNDNVTMAVKMAITVLNKTGEDKAGLALYYNKNTVIKSVKGVVLDAVGKLVSKFNQGNFDDMSAVSDFSLFEDDRVKRFMPSSVNYPYTVVYEYEIRFKQNMFVPAWHPTPYPDQSVESSSYTFSCKPGDAIRVKVTNYQGQPEISEGKEFKSQTWRIKNCLAFKPEPYAPNPETYLTCVKIAPVNFNYYGYKGSYNNWEELGKWIYTDLVKSRQVLTPEIEEEMRTLVLGISNDKEKARKIYDYVQQKTRYISVQVGIGGHQPMPATEVQRLSYGDCKALVNYTQSLLKAVNIPSYYCVVNAGNLKKNMDPDFASMDQGNHIILCLPLKNDTTWLECTDQQIPFGFLGSFTDDRVVLACTEAGGKLLRTPILSPEMNLLKRKAILELSDDGNISGKLETRFSGSQYDNYSSLINEPLKEQLKQLKTEYDIDNIDFSNLKLSQDKSDAPITLESLDLTIANYAPKSANHIYLVLNLFNKVRSIPESRTRTLPLYINRGYTDEDELSFKLPPGMEQQISPKTFLINSAFGSYQVTAQKQDGKLLYKRKFVLNSGTYPATQYKDFVTFMSDISSADQIKFVFKTDLTKD
ncbi:DUF3857 domain-containing protein [Pedobacter sp. MC2016-24]|uniref:DUF3857 domain-containing protein n=1 Tax=Pedobacter sp. MC2016-24 TaxID=2780090 RepID=UPI0018830562|nr:DUF3857 domain-containing protein [Pedobacter sp. MC2016-24]MBE9598115.1 DUF3857 domain-containing protein [Pedobacter sp. MC2016-24]